MTRAAPAPMACREVVELVTDYLEGTLDDVDRARFEAHIAGCPHCTAYMEQMRQTLGALGQIPEESLSEPARAELIQAFRNWRAA